MAEVETEMVELQDDELNQDEPTVGDSGEEEEYDEAESDEDVPEIILPSTSDIQAHTQAHTASRVGVANYLQTPIHLGAARQAAVTSKARTKTSVLELDIDTLEDKPWRKPGVDITQYFNYGFNEDTWRAYCGRQHQMKMESQNLGKISVYESNRENEREITFKEEPDTVPSVPHHKPYHHSAQQHPIQVLGGDDESTVIELTGPKPYRDPRAPRPIPVQRSFDPHLEAERSRQNERERNAARHYSERGHDPRMMDPRDGRMPPEMRGYDNRNGDRHERPMPDRGDRYDGRGMSDRGPPMGHDRGHDSRKRDRDPRSDRDSRHGGRDRRDDRDEKRARHS